MSSLPAAALSPLPKRRGSDKPVIHQHIDHHSMLCCRYVITTCNRLTFMEQSPRCLALPPGTRPNCSLAPSLPLRSITSLLGPLTWDSAKLQLGSFLTSTEQLPRCLALPPGTRSNCSLAPSLPPRSNHLAA
ncbi:hypothetical protein Adt_15036 [Abeliophyllum distichum]|uniref:Uncharacterized protein n=1 Tax=Abeliophyllum distichum TaxID=126358 RepID=A0ABD1U1D1_9LAMI